VPGPSAALTLISGISIVLLLLLTEGQDRPGVRPQRSGSTWLLNVLPRHHRLALLGPPSQRTELEQSHTSLDPAPSTIAARFVLELKTDLLVMARPGAAEPRSVRPISGLISGVRVTASSSKSAIHRVRGAWCSQLRQGRKLPYEYRCPQKTGWSVRKEPPPPTGSEIAWTCEIQKVDVLRHQNRSCIVVETEGGPSTAKAVSQGETIRKSSHGED